MKNNQDKRGKERADGGTSNERLTLTIEETAHLLGISRNLAYERAKTGEICAGLRVIKIGKRLLVSKKAVEELLQEPQPFNAAPAAK